MTNSGRVTKWATIWSVVSKRCTRRWKKVKLKI